MTGASPGELVEYAEGVRRWLEENATSFRRTQGPSQPTGSEPEEFALARRFQAQLHEAGYAGITAPREYGGQGLTDEHRQVFEQEASPYRLPNHPLDVSVNVIAEVLLACADHGVRATHVPKILSGAEVWLQLLSEPSGGSDPAALVTRATLEGDHYVLNGEKTWSTGAAAADYALCPARTDWTVPKHQGISVFIVDMRSPGIEIRPIRQIDGGTEFCQEYLTDVQVPVANVVGSINGGWTVVRRLLEIEHKWAGRRSTGRRAPGDVQWLIALAEEQGRTTDPAVRKLIASLHTQLRAHALLSARASREIAAGTMSPSYGALLKISNDSLVQRKAEVALYLAGPRALAWSPDDDRDGQWAHAFLNSRSASIGGGTTEMQRNNFSERALGLPREASPDRELPFNQVPHN